MGQLKPARNLYIHHPQVNNIITVNRPTSEQLSYNVTRIDKRMELSHRSLTIWEELNGNFRKPEQANEAACEAVGQCSARHFVPERKAYFVLREISLHNFQFVNSPGVLVGDEFCLCCMEETSVY